MSQFIVPQTYLIARYKIAAMPRPDLIHAKKLERLLLGLGLQFQGGDRARGAARVQSPPGELDPYRFVFVFRLQVEKRHIV